MPKEIWKGGALIAPLPPVLVTCSEKITDENGNETVKDNIITVAWTGITCTNPPKTYVSVRPGRFSHHIIENSREFVINLATADMAKSVDYCGVYTGAKVDKFEKCGFKKEKSQNVSCPSIAQCPLSIECKVTDVIRQGSHDMFLADIVAVRVDKKLIDEKGKLELSKADLLAFAHGEYFRLGERVGDFGFSARRERKKGTGRGFEKFVGKASREKAKSNPDLLFDQGDFDADELWGDDVEVVEIIRTSDGEKTRKTSDRSSKTKKDTKQSFKSSAKHSGEKDGFKRKNTDSHSKPRRGKNEKAFAKQEKQNRTYGDKSNDLHKCGGYNNKKTFKSKKSGKYGHAQGK